MGGGRRCDFGMFQVANRVSQSRRCHARDIHAGAYAKAYSRRRRRDESYVITVFCPVVYAANRLLIEVRCLVICRRATHIVYMLLTNVSYTALLVINAFCIQRRLKYPSISFAVLFLFAVTFLPTPLRIVWSA